MVRMLLTQLPVSVFPVHKLCCLLWYWYRLHISQQKTRYHAHNRRWYYHVHDYQVRVAVIFSFFLTLQTSLKQHLELYIFVMRIVWKSYSPSPPIRTYFVLRKYLYLSISLRTSMTKISFLCHMTCQRIGNFSNYEIKLRISLPKPLLSLL